MRKLLLFLSLAVICAQMVVAQNNAPVAVNDTVEAVAQVPLMINAIENDYDPDGDSIYMYSVDATISAVAQIEGQFIWYKPAYWDGEQTIQYVIKDDQNIPLQDVGRVIVNVLPNPDAPIAVPDTFELMALIPHNINVLANDYDPNANNIKIMGVSGVGYDCSVIINPDSLSLTVRTGLMNTDFKYRIVEETPEGYISRNVTVRIVVLPNPDCPVAVSDTIIVTGGIPYSIPVLDNDYDPQEDAFTVYDIPGVSHHGPVVIEGNMIKYTADLSYKGEDQFFYRIHEIDEPGIYSNWGQVKITVEKNPNCPIGEPDFASGTTGVPMIIDVIGNDHDPNGDEIALKSVSFGSITADNKIAYTSSNLSLGSDSIFYTVMERNNPDSYSEPTKVSIQLAVNPDLPVAVPDYVTTRAGMPIEIKPLENDIKNSYDTLQLYLVQGFQPVQGNTSHQNGIVRFSPAYAATGVQKIIYIIKGIEPDLVAARGEININIIPQHTYDSLNINNIVAGVNSNGNLFSFAMEGPDGLAPNPYDEQMYQRYRVPFDGIAHTIFYNKLILGGYDDFNYLHMGRISTDWKPGPVSNNQDTNYHKRYVRLWKLSRQEVEYHMQHYWQPDYQPIEAIASWPGNGFTNSGEALHLAPFFDVNADDNYVPEQGDYPLIRGDQCIFLMCNDDNLRTDTTALPLEAELHAMVYGYDQPDDTALFNTVFVHYDLINRSENEYNDCYAGVFTDFDIGYYLDDRFRTDVQRASMFAYNGNDIDGDGQFWAYGDKPPAQSVTVLAGPFMDSDGLDNPTGECNESVNGLNFENGITDDERHGLSRAIKYQRVVYSPIYIEETSRMIYNYLDGFWDDGTPFMFGGDGHPMFNSVGPECRFMFPGDSDPLNWGTNCEIPNGGYNQNGKYWTEEGENLNSGDRRALASMGPFTFAPGQVQEIELAYCTGLGNNGAMSSVHQLLRNIDSLRTAVAQGKIIVPNGSLGMRPDILPANVQLYPNPATDVIAISNMGANNGAEFTICNFYGSVVAKGVLTGSKPIIRVNHLAPGLYIIKISNGDTVSTGKFIKM